MYTYKKNQPKRREVDGPFKGMVWNPGGLYQKVPADKIGMWFEEEQKPEFRIQHSELKPDSGCAMRTDSIDNEQQELDSIIKKNSGGEIAGPDLDDTDKAEGC